MDTFSFLQKKENAGEYDILSWNLEAGCYPAILPTEPIFFLSFEKSSWPSFYNHPMRKKRNQVTAPEFPSS